MKVNLTEREINLLFILATVILGSLFLKSYLGLKEKRGELDTIREEIKIHDVKKAIKSYTKRRNELLKILSAVKEFSPDAFPLEVEMVLGDENEKVCVSKKCFRIYTMSIVANSPSFFDVVLMLDELERSKFAINPQKLHITFSEGKLEIKLDFSVFY